MTWPKDEYVMCVGFDKTLLPVLRRALSGKMVEWGHCSSYAGAFKTEFTWADCRWVIYEMNEYVESIHLLSGVITSEALTAALLKGKIESS